MKEEHIKYLDNTGLTTGMQKFAWDHLDEFIGCKTPSFHDKMLRAILFCYVEREIDSNGNMIRVINESKFDRQLAMVAFRGSAKTTMTTLLVPLYNTVFKGETFILKYKGKLYEGILGEDLTVICSKVGYVAEQRLVNIRNYLSTENKLTREFGLFKPRMLRDGKTKEWKRNIFVTNNNAYFFSLGAGQMIRGTNIDGFRPTLLLFDDIYSQENTTTPERRQKIDEWFFTEAINSVDDLRGKIIFIGTIVHEDTVPKKLKDLSTEKSPLWRYLEIAAINVEELHTILAKIDFNRSTGKFDMPEDHMIYGWEKELKSIAWKERCGLRFILNLYRSNLRNLDYIYQEYLNVVQAPENKQFTQEMFIRDMGRSKYEWKNNQNWVLIADEGVWYNASIYIGVDLASSSSKESDDTVIMVTAVLSDGRAVVLSYKCGKMGQRDDLYKKTDIDTFRRSQNEIRKPGSVDTVLRLAESYHPTLVIVESISEQIKTFQEINRVARNSDFYVRTMTYKPATNKIERIVNTLLGMYQIGNMIHQPDMQDLEYQLEKLGKAKHDDLPDALHMCMMFAKKPREAIKNALENKKDGMYIRQTMDWQTV